MGISTQGVAARPRSAIKTALSGKSAVWYKCFEGTGSDLVDTLGNGPTLTFTGGTSEWTNEGWLTPDNSLEAQDTSTSLGDIFKLSDAAQIIVCLDHWVASAATAGQNPFAFSFGQVTGAGSDGAWGVHVLDDSTPTLRFEFAPTGGTRTLSSATGALTQSQRNFCVLDWQLDAPSQQWYVNGQTNGTGTTDALASGDRVGNSPTGGFVFAARWGSSGIDSRLADSDAGNRIANVFFLKLSEVDTTLASEIASDMNDMRGDLSYKVLDKINKVA